MDAISSFKNLFGKCSVVCGLSNSAGTCFLIIPQREELKYNEKNKTGHGRSP
jgi:hypothetical protein